MVLINLNKLRLVFCLSVSQDFPLPFQLELFISSQWVNGSYVINVYTLFIGQIIPMMWPITWLYDLANQSMSIVDLRCCPAPLKCSWFTCLVSIPSSIPLRASAGITAAILAYSGSSGGGGVRLPVLANAARCFMTFFLACTFICLNFVLQASRSLRQLRSALFTSFTIYITQGKPNVQMCSISYMILWLH